VPARFTKVPAYLLPSLHDALAQNHPAELLTLAVAGWFRYLRAVDLDGAPITVVDARAAAYSRWPGPAAMIPARY
jgi:mannitol-1-phosphate/altronate dehydrogenase